MFQKNRTMSLLFTEISAENHPGKRKNRNPEATQKVPDAELLY